MRFVRAVRKVGSFPPPVATDPRFLKSAPYSPCWYTRDVFFCLMLATGPRVLKSATMHELIMHPSVGEWFSGVFPG